MKAQGLEGLTLRQYQASAGIPLGEQLLLLENRPALRDWHACIYPHHQRRGSALTYLAECWRSKNWWGRHRKVVSVSRRNRRLYLGYYDKSLDALTRLPEVFRRIEAKAPSRFVLLIGKGDYEISPSVLGGMPENLVALAANNVNVADPRVLYLPMGRDFRSRLHFAEFPPSEDKTLDCYCNFSVNTHPIRSEVQGRLRGKPFVEFEHMNDFLHYSISREDFYAKLRASKFSVCPRGNAIDTFRVWDSLYLGTIPIVVREAVFHQELDDLPILFLDSYDEFAELTKDSLDRTYAEMRERSYDYRKLTASFWLNRLSGRIDR